MSPRKLTNSNKEEILDLYRTSPETTSTLAERYGVSSSTISRFLKSNLSEPEYEELIQQKRLGRTPSRREQSELIDQQQLEVAEETGEEQPYVTLDPVVVSAQAEIPAQNQEVESEKELFEEEGVESVDVASLGEMLGEDLADLDEEEDLAGGEEDEWEDELEVRTSLSLSKRRELQVLPLSAASFPKICYLVVDRAADLIALPLKEFGDLGAIPATEIGQKTLPIFDNQRVARRFSNRFQRVIKVPDGRLLEATSSHLEAKGITRLLLDGKVYSLST